MPVEVAEEGEAVVMAELSVSVLSATALVSCGDHLIFATFPNCIVGYSAYRFLFAPAAAAERWALYTYWFCAGATALRLLRMGFTTGLWGRADGRFP
jgi:Flp pilus assembly protein protease CpaA